MTANLTLLRFVTQAGSWQLWVGTLSLRLTSNSLAADVSGRIVSMGAEALVSTAARNNAEWCDIVCRTRGLTPLFDVDLWASPQRTPPHYPDAVTLNEAVAAPRIFRIVDTETPGCSVKDSFASLDLSSAGYRRFLEAEWIIRYPELSVRAGRLEIDWRHIREARQVEAWEASRSAGRFTDRLLLPALLSHSSIAVLGGYIDDRLVAGFVLNKSRDSVGVSNLFTTAGEIANAWQGCVTEVARTSPGLPIVGYESGDYLTAAHEQGFTSIGPLCIWMNEHGASSG